MFMSILKIRTFMLDIKDIWAIFAIFSETNSFPLSTLQLSVLGMSPFIFELGILIWPFSKIFFDKSKKSK